MQLKDALRLKGFKVKDLHERMTKQSAISYAIVAKYCRCWNSKYFDKEIWRRIKENLKEMEVEWDG